MAALGAACVAFVAAVGGVRGTAALFTDTATIATTGGISAGYLDPPTGVVCSTTPTVYIRWTPGTGHVPNTGWRVSYTNTTTNATTVDNSVPPGTTQWRPPGVSVLTTYSVVVAATRGNWISANSSPAVRISATLTVYSCP